MLGIGIQLKLSVSVNVTACAMGTVTHLLEAVFECIQMICSVSFCNKGTGGEKKRMGAINCVSFVLLHHVLCSLARICSTNETD